MCFWSMLYKKYNVWKTFSYYILCSWDWRTLTLAISNIKVRHVLVKGQGQMSISTEVTLKTWPPCLRLKLLYNVRTTRKLRKVKAEIIYTFHWYYLLHYEPSTRIPYRKSKTTMLREKMVNRKENYFDYYYSKKEGHNLSK